MLTIKKRSLKTIKPENQIYRSSIWLDNDLYIVVQNESSVKLEDETGMGYEATYYGEVFVYSKTEEKRQIAISDLPAVICKYFYDFRILPKNA